MSGQSELNDPDSEICQGYDVIIVSLEKVNFYVHKDVVSIFSKKLAKLIDKAEFESTETPYVIKLDNSISDLQSLLGFIYHLGFKVNIYNYNLILELAQKFECVQLAEEVVHQLYLKHVASNDFRKMSYETFSELFTLLQDVQQEIPVGSTLAQEKIATFIANCSAHKVIENIQNPSIKQEDGHRLVLFDKPGEDTTYQYLDTFLKECEDIQSQKVAGVLLEQFIRNLLKEIEKNGKLETDKQMFNSIKFNGQEVFFKKDP